MSSRTRKYSVNEAFEDVKATSKELQEIERSLQDVAAQLCSVMERAHHLTVFLEDLKSE